MASEYSDGSQAINNTFVYDDGIVKGIVRLHDNVIEKLFVEPNFQNRGIGAELLKFAVSVMHAEYLWALKYNERAISFYKRHGFVLTGEKIIEDECVPLLKMSIKRTIQLKKMQPDSPDKSILKNINRSSFPDEQITDIDDLFLSDKGDLDIIGIYLDDLLVGFFTVRVYKDIRYIGYFAIAPEHRCKGIGSKALALLGEYYPEGQLVVEIEAANEDCDNNALRLRRRSFYLKNGYFSTGWYLFYDDVELEVLCSDTDFKKQEFKELTNYIHSLYYDTIPEIYRK